MGRMIRENWRLLIYAILLMTAFNYLSQPVHLNELSPPAWRGTFPGVVYQMGNLLSVNAAMLQAKLAEHFVRPNGRRIMPSRWPA